MKNNKEIISLNSIKDEFNDEMGIDERFKILSFSEQQKVKGGDCPSDHYCGPMGPNPCPCLNMQPSCECDDNDPGCMCDGFMST